MVRWLVLTSLILISNLNKLQTQTEGHPDMVRKLSQKMILDQTINLFDDYHEYTNLSFDEVELVGKK